MILFIAVTSHFLSYTGPECFRTQYPSGSVELRFSPPRKGCLREWRYNDSVLAHDGDGGKDSMPEYVLDFTDDHLLLKSCMEKITFIEECLDSQGERIIPYVFLPPDDHGKDHYLALGFVLLFILLLSGAVLGFLCKKKPNLCHFTTCRDESIV